jgi:hypothetical protein
MFRDPAYRPSRRAVLGGAAGLLVPAVARAEPPPAPLRLGQAEHCIFMWLGGGMSQIDTFDPKRVGDWKSAKKAPGAYYPSIPTAVPGVRVCEHLARLAPLMDRVTAVRSITHSTVDEHATATHFVHTGRLISETIRYPSIGSIVAHELGQTGPDAPAYMVIGYPNTSRDPGFLGPKHGYVHVVEADSGPAAFARPAAVTPARQARREQLLGTLRKTREKDAGLAEYDTVLRQSLDLSGPKFMRLFDLKDEPAELRRAYGGEFGQRCLLARRLVEGGVRFVEVSHNLNFVNGTGWDIHNEGHVNQHLLIRDLEGGLATLITDLERRGKLDKTLIVVASEFGRPPGFDAGGGRGHQSKGCTLVLAGGGLRHRGAYGATDDLSAKVAADPVTIPDFHATICAALGINPRKELYDGSRPVPITDDGHPIAGLFG